MRSLCGLYFYKSVQFIYLYFLCLICLYCPLHCPSITPSGKRSAQIQSNHTDFESQSTVRSIHVLLFSLFDDDYDGSIYWLQAHTLTLKHTQKSGCEPVCAP